jgi:hypothetical protein
MKAELVGHGDVKITRDDGVSVVFEMVSFHGMHGEADGLRMRPARHERGREIPADIAAVAESVRRTLEPLRMGWEWPQ